MSSGVDLFRLCRCGHRNDVAQSVCSQCQTDINDVAVTFGASEREAPPTTVTGGEPQPRRSPDDGQPGIASDGSGPDQRPCACLVPIEAADGLTCDACGHPLSNTAQQRTTPPPVRENGPKAAVYMELPGGRRIVLGSGTLIGRDQTAVEASIASALESYRGVSGRHLWLAADQDAVVLVDLGSRNHTWTESHQLESYALHRIPLSDLPCPIWLGGKVKLLLISEERT